MTESGRRRKTVEDASHLGQVKKSDPTGFVVELEWKAGGLFVPGGLGEPVEGELFGGGCHTFMVPTGYGGVWRGGVRGCRFTSFVT